MGYKFNRRDKTHSEIVQAFRDGGCAVQDLAAVGHGCPDLVVSFNGRNYMVECKSKTGKLKPGQIEWAQSWKAPVIIVRSAQVAESLVGFWRQGIMGDAEVVE